MTAEALNAPFKHSLGRALSLLMAVPLSLVLLVHPASMLDADGHYSHSLLMLVMWGVAGGFVHGVGFDPRALVWRVVFHPLLAWGLMGIGYGVWLMARQWV
ncbi:cyd operon YbgE family protein [Pseudomonas sp. UBA1879]|uniref:cyd operon YbgE family protein n=1 Tax=Pseudomonas sp. UBA1879 TaxID=1947305 RepID=UPI0025FB7CC7|nr:cyd operon YbgE family protein [Pseudomonas sp. UBA1879]